MRFFISRGSWIYQPSSVQIAAYSESLKDGEFTMEEKFEDIYEEPLFRYKGNMAYLEYKHNNSYFPDEKSRYIEIRIKNFGVIPEGKQGAGNRAWLFIDEIIID